MPHRNTRQTKAELTRLEGHANGGFVKSGIRNTKLVHFTRCCSTSSVRQVQGLHPTSLRECEIQQTQSQTANNFAYNEVGATPLFIIEEFQADLAMSSENSLVQMRLICRCSRLHLGIRWIARHDAFPYLLIFGTFHRYWRTCVPFPMRNVLNTRAQHGGI